MKFKEKNIFQAETLGEKLRRLREERGNTFEEVALLLHVSREYIIALEAGEYKNLPGPLYVRRYIKKYAEFLEINPNTALSLFEKEILVWKEPRDISTETHLIKKPFVVERYVLWILFALMMTGLGVYLLGEAIGIFKAPALEVSLSPLSQTHDSAITVEGKTEKEAEVRINNQSVQLNSEGNFSEIVPLQEGLNSLTIESRKKFSKERVLIREVIKN